MRRYAHARRHTPGQMNGLEQAWADELSKKVLAVFTGNVMAWKFERVTLKLADDTRYTPDFFVVTDDGGIEFHETKGFMRGDAAVKLKVAATQFPWFVFKLVTRKGGVWQVHEVPPID